MYTLYSGYSLLSFLYARPRHISAGNPLHMHAWKRENPEAEYYNNQEWLVSRIIIFLVRTSHCNY